MKRQGAVGDKCKDSRSDMSDFWHKYMDSYGEMMVSSGIKTGTPVTMKMERTGGPLQRYKT